MNDSKAPYNENNFTNDIMYARIFKNLLLNSFNEQNILTKIILFGVKDNIPTFTQFQYDLTKSKHIIQINKVIQSLQDYFGNGKNKISLHELANQVFLYTEIICEEQDKREIITDQNINQISKSSTIGQENDYFSFIVDYLTSKKGVINLYYSEKNFKILALQPENAYQNNFNVSLIESENHIKEYFNNIRWFIATCVNLFYFLTNLVKNHCDDFIIEGFNEAYWGTLQELNTVSLKLLFTDIQSYDLFLAFDEVNKKYLAKANICENEFRLARWVTFMSGIEEYVQKLSKINHLESEFDKLCLLLLYLFEEKSNDDEVEKIKILLNKCFNIISVDDSTLEKQVDTWSLYTFNKLVENLKNCEFQYYYQDRLLEHIKKKINFLKIYGKLDENSRNCLKMKLDEAKREKEFGEKELKKLYNLRIFLSSVKWIEDRILQASNIIYEFQKHYLILEKKINMFNINIENRINQSNNVFPLSYNVNGALNGENNNINGKNMGNSGSFGKNGNIVNKGGLIGNQINYVSKSNQGIYSQK